MFLPILWFVSAHHVIQAPVLSFPSQLTISKMNVLNKFARRTVGDGWQTGPGALCMHAAQGSRGSSMCASCPHWSHSAVTV